MKTLKHFALLGALALAIIMTSCSKDDDVQPAYTPQDGNAQLSTQEYTGLIDLYEQQKLHLDVYTMVSEETGSALFQKLLLEEEIVLDLLAEKFEAYDERNPLKLKVPGEFLSSEAQQTYSDFQFAVNAGLLPVLQLAVDMEESTVADIKVYMDVLQKEDITLVCTEMKANSTTHIDLIKNEMKSHNVVIEPVAPGTEF